METVAIDKVQPLERNPRKHPRRQIDELIKSVEKFGQYRPIVVDGDGSILAGNGLYAALKEMGHDKVDVYRMKALSEQDRNKLILADNRLADMSSDDFEVIEQMVAELSDYEVPGFDPDVLQGIIADADDVLDSAQSYGVLSDEERERTGSRANDPQGAGELQEDAPSAQVTLGGEVPAESNQDVQVDFSLGTPAGDALADAVETRKAEGHVCPACGRPW